MPLWCCFVSGLPLPELSEDIVWGYEKIWIILGLEIKNHFLFPRSLAANIPCTAPNFQSSSEMLERSGEGFFPFSLSYFYFLLLCTSHDFWSCRKLFDMAKLIMGGKSQFKCEIKRNHVYMHNKMSTQWNEFFTSFQRGPLCSSSPGCLERRYYQGPGTGSDWTPKEGLPCEQTTLWPPLNQQTWLFCLFFLFYHSACSALSDGELKCLAFFCPCNLTNGQCPTVSQQAEEAKATADSGSSQACAFRHGLQEVPCQHLTQDVPCSQVEAAVTEEDTPSGFWPGWTSN